MEQKETIGTNFLRVITAVVCLASCAAIAYELMALARTLQDELAYLLFLGLPFMLLFELVAALSGIAILAKAIFLLIMSFGDKELFFTEFASVARVFAFAFIAAAGAAFFTRQVVHDYLWSWTSLVILAIGAIALVLPAACVDKEMLTRDLCAAPEAKTLLIIMLVCCAAAGLVYLLSLCPNARTIVPVKHEWRWVFSN